MNLQWDNVYSSAYQLHVAIQCCSTTVCNLQVSQEWKWADSRGDCNEAQRFCTQRPVSVAGFPRVGHLQNMFYTHDSDDSEWAEHEQLSCFKHTHGRSAICLRIFSAYYHDYDRWCMSFSCSSSVVHPSACAFFSTSDMLSKTSNPRRWRALYCSASERPRTLTNTQSFPSMLNKVKRRQRNGSSVANIS